MDGIFIEYDSLIWSRMDACIYQPPAVWKNVVKGPQRLLSNQIQLPSTMGCNLYYLSLCVHLYF